MGRVCKREVLGRKNSFKTIVTSYITTGPRLPDDRIILRHLDISCDTKGTSVLNR